MTAAGRPFSPLISPQLASINLAYLKEIDVLQARRMEAKGKKSQGGGTAMTEEESPSPKRRPKFPKKPKGASDAQ